jgi:DNA-binding SARP family transcriptional activator/tetratricopeptide (TPR) repeat protein
LGTPKQRVVLATLLVHGNEVVSVDRLLEALWDHAPPPTARTSLQVYVSRLRKALHVHVGGGRSDQPERDQILRSRPHGYLLRVDADQLDLLRFERLVAQGRQALVEHEPDRAARILREATGLWRGPALTGVSSASEWLRRVVAPRLEEARLAALESRVEADLACGRHSELIGELTSLSMEHPLRERLHGQWMLALYRAGRQGEALAAYRALRDRLVDELGVEPTRSLQELQRRLLAGDPALDPPAGPVALPSGNRGQPSAPTIPRQLPADIAGFTGRQSELGRLEQALAATAQPGPIVISAIDGAGGIGKSALAIHAAHRVTDRFPDGQLYVNLQGATAGLEPLRSLEVLGRFLRALGVDGRQIPTGLDEAAARFRTEAAPRRLLILLDNAYDAAQVTPLIPGSPSCGVLVTSRRILGALGNTRHLHLDVLSLADAVELLARFAGPERIAAEPDAAAQVAHCCGYLPLAVRIAGAKLASRPSWRVATLAERLADMQRRLDELDLGDVGVRASVAISHQQLGTSADPVDRAAAEAFPLLGLPDGPTLSLAAAARLLGQPEPAAERVLERLVDAHLLETPAPGRYRMHDLLRLYAREQTVDESERTAALTRLFGWYAATTWHSMWLLRPGERRGSAGAEGLGKGGLEFADAVAALAWLEAERLNLVAAVTQAAVPGPLATMALQLAQALYAFFVVRSYWQDSVRVYQLALALARQVGDRAVEAQVGSDLGTVHFFRGSYDEALTRLLESLTLRRQLGDRRGQAASLGNLGMVCERLGRYDEALAWQQESLTIRRDLGDRYGQANSLNNLGIAHLELEQYDQALACLQEGLAIRQELDDRHGQAASLGNLGMVYGKLGRYDEALRHFHRSRTIDGKLGDRNRQAETMNAIGSIQAQLGRYDEALTWQRESLAIRRERSDRYGEAQTLRELGLTLRALGLHEQARQHWRQAVAIFEQLKTTPAADEVRALLSNPEPTTSSRST